MSEEAKTFIFGIQMSQNLKGMNWYGPVPKEIKELFDLDVGEFTHGVTVMGVYVKLNPKFQPFDRDKLLEVE